LRPGEKETEMDQNVEKNVYRFAHEEAASELREILNSFERLYTYKEKIENLIAVLRPEVGDITELQQKPGTQPKTHLPDCVVVTRLTVL
jgi:hypothetical protein